ncbi:MAG: TRAP transporter large permease subunit, partial [Stellaceae bacterium]
MANAGFYMLACVPVLLIATGLPAFMILIFVATLFAAIGVLMGAMPYELLEALPQRIIGLLETDLLQALPLYVLMGALLNRLPLADILFRAFTSLFARTAAAPLLAAVGLGAMLAPMNGSVGASVATLSRIVLPRLHAHRVSSTQGL